MASKKTRLILISAGLVFVALMIGYSRTQGQSAPAGTKTAAEIPVDVATVNLEDIPVNLEGLGTVQAFNTVNVSARVDGQIETIHFTEGQDVKKNALLAQIDPRPYKAALDQAQATLAKDKVQLGNAKRDLARYEQLAPDNITSQQTVDTQRALVAQLEAQLKSDQAIIDNARTQLDYTSIRSPIAGRTGIRLVDAGNLVRAAGATTIVVVTQIEPISILFNLPEDNFGDISAALRRGAVQAVAVSRDRREEIDRGTVTLIDNQIDSSTGTIRVKATFPNTGHKLWPGEFVYVRMQTQVKKQVKVIPESAVQRGPDGLFTYRIKDDATVEMVPLQADYRTGHSVVVSGSLEAGQRVVASNQYRLQPGAKIRPNTDKDKKESGVTPPAKDTKDTQGKGAQSAAGNAS